MIARAAAKPPLGFWSRGYNGTDRENSQYEVVSSDSIALRRPCEVTQNEARGGASLVCSPASAQRPSRLVVLPCRRWATRSAIAAHGPSPGRAALAPRRSRSNFLPTSRSAPREPAPESSLLGRSRPRASARRPSRRSMCGRACTPRTRAAARALTGTGSRLAAWSARPFKFLSHSVAAKRAHSADWRRSWSEGVATEAQLATGASSATQAFALG